MTPDHPDPGSPDHIERSLVCYDPADRPVIETAFRRCAEEGRPYDLELPLTRIDGRRIWVRTTAHALKEEGRVKKIIGNIVDITDRKQAEEERGRLMTQIRRQAQQMEQVLSTVPVGVLQFDAKGRVLHANPVGAQDLDMLADAHVGQTLTHLGDRPLAELLTSPPAGGLWHEVKAAGHVFEVLARPVENGAEAKQWVMVLNDVTQELETRTQLAQQERLAAVGQLAAGIAHDLNNNLAVIALYTQMALREPVMPPKTHERLSTVSQQVKRMAALIQQILDFSRRAMLERQPLNLVPFMKEIVKLLERTIPEHIEVRLTASRNSEDLIAYADPTRMQQIVMNLAVNARDAMPEGGRLDIELERVTVERGRSPLRPKMAPGDWIKLAVSDNGSGIPLEVMPHIFEPFYTTKGPGEGTGLGLAQVYGIVEQHGGRIDVTTEIDQGTTFTIYLPALGVQPFEPTSEKSAALWQGHGEVVLVVEDDPTLRAALVAGLEQLNYRTLQVGNGEHALALLAQPDQDIALVLSDVVMPGIGRHSSLPSIAGERAPRAGHPPHRPRHGRGDRVAQRTRLGGLVNQTAAARAVGAGDRAGAPPGAKWLTGSYVGVVRITLNKPLTHR
jgi:signal transduction histidine kinase